MKLLSMICQNCNGQLEVNIEEMQAYCPYCGHKLLFDLDQMEMVLAEKEKTKRAEERTKRVRIEQEYKDKKDIRDKKVSIGFAVGLVGLYIFLMLFSVFMMFYSDYEHKINYEVQVEVSSRDLKNKDYNYVLERLSDSGFYNIELIEEEDLMFGFFAKENEVESVTIDGDSSFSEDDYFPIDAVVEITYHTYKK